MSLSSGERIVRTVCQGKDASACGILAHARDNVLTKVEPADFPEPSYRHICSKGLCAPQLVHHPDRLKYPLKRVGDRGEGNWRRITWDEALDATATRFQEIGERYGRHSVSWMSGGGNALALVYERLANTWGGTSVSLIGFGDAAAPCADIVSFGPSRAFPLDRGFTAWFESPRLFVLWGSNDTETRISSWKTIRDGRENGAKVVVIDPRFTPTAAKADTWLPIIPGTDGALALGMMNIIVSRRLEDKSFISNHTVGPFLVRADTGLFLREKDISSGESTEKYVVWDTMKNRPEAYDKPGVIPALEGLYSVDGISCKPAFQLLADLVEQYTPERASGITGIDPDAIKSLAVDYASRKPVVTRRGMGCQRTFHGDLAHRSIITLAAITGNINSQGRERIELKLNFGPFLAPARLAKHLPVLSWYKAVITGDPYSVKAMWVSSHNVVNQLPNANMMVNEIIPRLEFIVAVDMFMTTSAEYADIVLPVCTSYECIGLAIPFHHPYLQLQQKVIEPLYESRSDLDIATGLAHKMGVGEYFDKSPEEFIELLLSCDSLAGEGITLEKLKEDPIKQRKHVMSFATPSQRLEFYSERLKGFGEELPIYREPLESARKPLAGKYPLSFINAHSRHRIHSMYANVDRLKELDPEPMLEMNHIDAKKRNIKDGEIVIVFNDRGKTKVKALVHGGIRCGVVCMTEGWWPKQFLEGSHQELTHEVINPAQQAIFEPNAALYDILVEVKKVEGE